MEQNFYRNLVILGLFIIIIILLLIFYLHYTKKFIQKTYTPDEYDIINPPKPDIKYMDGIDVIYWINLDRSIDRRNHMEKIFQDPVFQYSRIERISAVDGKNPNVVYPKLNFIHKQKNDYEYACMLSHLDSIRRFSKTTYDVALIMEDDITLDFKKYWRKSVREIIQNAPPDWEIIQLCYIINGNRTNPSKFKLYQRNLRHNCVSAAAYLIKNQAAKKLINGIYNDGKYNLEHYIIHHADCYIFSKLITYTYKYPYFIYKSNNDSLLHPEDLDHHEISKLKIVNMYNRLTS
jgi:GR25 family glycosyltransferase involved in LPS biosynthesis